jgi:hypothetical protein
MDRASKLIVEGITYFQLVFTLPAELSSLALGNRKPFYKMLMEVAWRAARKKIEEELGLRAVGCGVLHTWNQRLGHHPHVHMLVAGSGPSVDGKKWIACRMTSGKRGKDAKPRLVDYRELGDLFRNMFLRTLRRRLNKGKIVAVDQTELDQVLRKLASTSWNVFIQGPPKSESSATQVIKYLTRYMTGGPISDRRIVGEENGRVYFLARNADDSSRMDRASLPATEFVQQWALHILPKGFVRARFYGGWSGSKRCEYQKLVKTLRASKHGEPVVEETAKQASDENPKENPKEKPKPCPKCAVFMVELNTGHRPSWTEVRDRHDLVARGNWTPATRQHQLQSKVDGLLGSRPPPLEVHHGIQIEVR